MTDIYPDQDVDLCVSSPEFCKHGYHSEAGLSIQPGMGRYVVTLGLLPDGHEEREVAWEPSEPDARVRGVTWAFNNPQAAVLDAIAIDKARRDEEKRIA